jgi:hypothetical protein
VKTKPKKTNKTSPYKSLLEVDLERIYYYLKITKNIITIPNTLSRVPRTTTGQLCADRKHLENHWHMHLGRFTVESKKVRGKGEGEGGGTGEEGVVTPSPHFAMYLCAVLFIGLTQILIFSY